jgi:signal transduction histidine kinase/CheY-like chemotaxis protein
MSLNQDRVAEISQSLFDRRQFAYFLLDTQWCVLEASNNLQDFGFSNLEVGVDATDEIDFLVGIDISDNHELSMISSPAGDPIRVTFIPSVSTITVVIMDARQEFLRQKQVQQKANENELLLGTQEKLLSEIEEAKIKLELQNVELQEAARLQSSFLSGVSHEFRTPLTSIMGYTNLLLKDSDETSANYLSAMKRSSKYLLSLIENLLDHGKFDSNEIMLNPKSTELAEVFSDVELLVRPLAETKSVNFTITTDWQAACFVVLDDSRLRQCLINIIGNAIKFTDQGSVTVVASLKDDDLHVSVEDTGIGVSEEHLKKIKQPFWQAPDTGKSGTGLGLTITERIIEMMGGALDIDSSEGVGTTVSFNVMAPSIEPTFHQEAQVLTQFNRSLSVLMAEDDEDIAFLVTLLLEEQGVKVVHVANGALAVDRLQHEDFDLVLMDLHMPVLNGYDAVSQIRGAGNTTPIVIMTASAIEADKGRAQELGCDGYLVKPVDIADLLNIAQQLVT